jgi:hypothetical protein
MNAFYRLLSLPKPFDFRSENAILFELFFPPQQIYSVLHHPLLLLSFILSSSGPLKFLSCLLPCGVSFVIVAF